MADRKGRPLRKIVRTLECSLPKIGVRALVLLECGHEIRSDGIYRARCHKCRSPMPPVPEES